VEYVNQPLPTPVDIAPAPLESRVRFSLRGVFITTAAVAICLAAISPWLRHRTADERKALAKIWGNVAAGAVATVGGGCVLRLREERRAGAARYRLPLSVTALAAVCSVAGSLFLLAMVALVSFVEVPPANQMPVFNTVAIQAGVVAALAGLGLWWRSGCLELCDNGLLQGFNLIPYKSIRGFRWGTSGPNLLVVQVGLMTVTVRLHAEDKPGIEQYLQSRLAPPKDEELPED
jgi:hypothetical protein